MFSNELKFLFYHRAQDQVYKVININFNNDTISYEPSKAFMAMIKKRRTNLPKHKKYTRMDIHAYAAFADGNLLMFTGYLTKKGKEIYDNDILIISGGAIGVVYMDTDEGMWKVGKWLLAPLVLNEQVKVIGSSLLHHTVVNRYKLDEDPFCSNYPKKN